MTTTIRSTTPAHTCVRDLFAAMQDGDLAEFTRITSAVATNRAAVDEPLACRMPGPEGFHATALWLRGMFADLRWKIHEIVAEGDLVVAHTTMSGRHTGTFTKYDKAGDVAMSRPAGGLAFAVQQSHWYRLADGLVIEHWADRDDLGMVVQLGFLGPPPPAT